MTWLSFWEFIEYSSEASVAVGCVGEYIAEYTRWRTEEQRHALGRRSLLILILGIGGGLLSLIQTNTLSGKIIESLGEQAAQAGKKAQLASDASDAATQKAKSVVTLASGAQGAAAHVKMAGNPQVVSQLVPTYKPMSLSSL